MPSAVDAFLDACARGDRAEAEPYVFGDPEFVRRLDAADVAILPEAARDNRIEAVRLMLDLGFPLDARSHDGFTAAQLAAANGHAELLDLLLSHGAPR